jgi:aspartate racemase
MKTIGIIGGMSWESSLIYYRLLNEGIRERLGGLHSCPCILYSVDFNAVERWQRENHWELLGNYMVKTAGVLEKAGADLILLATNTMHIFAAEIESKIRIPFLHIADCAGKAIKEDKLRKVALLGTRFTMERDFYPEHLQRHFGIETMVPDEADRELIHSVIYQELVYGNIRRESRESLQVIIRRMAHQGAEGVILGCTELPMLIGPSDSPLPVYDTTRLHCVAALDLVLGSD